jgi:hypothetical protein
MFMFYVWEKMKGNIDFLKQKILNLLFKKKIGISLNLKTKKKR